MKDSYAFYTNKLSGEYKTVFEQVEMYLLSRNIDEAAREERLGDLLDIFLSGQEAGKPVWSITGRDIERFCRTFCSDFGIKDYIMNIVDWFKSIAWICAVISAIDLVTFLFDAMETGDFDIRHSAASLNISGYLLGVLVAGALAIIGNIVIRNVMFRKKRIFMKVLKAASFGIAILSFLIIFFLLSLEETNLFDCPPWIVFVVSGGYLLLYYLLRGRRIKRQKIKFSHLIREEFHKEFSDEMEKKFQRAKKKSIKKGKGPLSLEAFLDKEEKDCILTEKLKYFYIVMPIIITAVSYVVVFFAEGFETNMDSIIYIIIMLLVEYPIMLGFYKISKNGVAERRAWIQEKRKGKQSDE